MSRMRFDLLGSDGSARRGRLTFPRGVVETPTFMPVGTYGSVKAMTPAGLRELGAQIILGNTFHLYLRPGLEVIAAHGGLHGFAQWDGPILTDSGGFQVFSLAHRRKITEQGVTFASPVDGSKVFLGPEESMRIQRALDSDIVMIFDECTPYEVNGVVTGEKRARESMELSLRWAVRSKAAFGQRGTQALFAIVQGGVDENLRRLSAEALVAEGFDGYAIGGLAVGEGHQEMLRALDFTTPLLPAERPRYLMGVGKPIDIVEAVVRGVDMFDCVLPTRSGRHGQAWSDAGPVNLKNARFAEDMAPLDETLDCPASRDYSRAYLHHLVKSEELLAQVLLSWHNIAYYQKLMARLRAAIAAGTLDDFAEAFRAGLAKIN